MNKWLLVEVKETARCSVVNLARLADYLAYPVYVMNGAKVVVLKHSTQILH